MKNEASMADEEQNQKMPELPEWLKRYDVSVGPYDEPSSLDQQRTTDAGAANSELNRHV